MPTNLLILPLIAGYCFLHLLAYTRYRAQRLDGHRLVLECVLLAIPLSAIGRGLAYLLWKVELIRRAWVEVAPTSANFEYFGTAILSIVAAFIIPAILNWLGEKFDRNERGRRWLARIRVYSHRRALSTAMERHGTELHRLFYRALDTERPVSITLDNKKVYIGYVAGAPKLEPFDTYVSIIPILSGYRDGTSLDLKLTQNYIAVYERENLDRAEFTVVLPLTQIRTASYFDQQAYSKFEIRSGKPEDAEPTMVVPAGSHPGAESKGT